MALGKTNTDKLNQYVTEIYNAINFGNETSECIYSVWNTFQYVAKNLSVWADETIVGANVKQNVTNLANALYEMMNSQTKLNTKILKFIAEQRLLNSDSTTIDKARGASMLDHLNGDLP